MKKLLYLLYTGALVLLAYGCGGGKANESQVPEEKITNVEIFATKRTNFKEYLNLPVVVTAYKEANIGLTAGGKITKINADKGDFVRQGQTLLETDNEQIKAALSAAEANLEYQKSDFERNKKLLDEGSIPQASFDASKLALAQAKASYDQAKKQMEDSVLKAPFDGTITSRIVEMGEILSPGSPAFRLIDVSRVKVQAGIPEKNITEFKKGNTVSIQLDALPGKEFEGRINYIAPEATTTVRTFLCEIIVENRSGLIKAGTMGNARIEESTYSDVLVVPLNALIDTHEGRMVFVAKNDTIAESRIVTTDGSNGDMIVVNSGINEGEEIITRGQRDVVNGERIKITGEYKAQKAEDSTR